MLKRPKPKTFTEAEQAAINAASAAQTGQSTTIKSYDPNFPVFEVPVNQKLLVYIPNHTVMDADGGVHLRMDKFAAHRVIDGRSFSNVRCADGVVIESLGLDGTCPLCQAMSECWDLYNKEYADIARARGIVLGSPEEKDALKEERQKLVSGMVIERAKVWYTFPIVVIECVEKDGKLTLNPKRTADNGIIGKPCFYSIKQDSFITKWGAAFDALDDVDEDGNSNMNPAGRWAVLNFTYQSKDGSYNKMQSALNLSVAFKDMQGYEKWAEYFDKMTEEWTPEKAREVLVLDAMHDMDELHEAADTIMRPVRDKLAMYTLSANSAGAPVPVASSADAALANFGGGEAVNPAPAGVPDMGEMPSAPSQFGVETE